MSLDSKSVITRALERPPKATLPALSIGRETIAWGLFLISNISTAAYASVNKGDWAMAAAIFLRNGVGCIAIIAVAAWQRAKSHQRTTRLDTKVIPLIFGRAA